MSSGKDQATALRNMMLPTETESNTPVGRALSGNVLIVAGGKWGVGKSQVALNLAAALSEMKERILLVDWDPSLLGIAPLLGIRTRWNLSDVVSGVCSISDIVTKTPAGFHLLTLNGGNDFLFRSVPDEDGNGMAIIMRLFENYDRVIVEVPAGVTPASLSLMRRSGDLVLVSTPDPIAFTEAYGLLKRLNWESISPTVRLVMNMVESERQAGTAAEGFAKITRSFLKTQVEFLGSIPYEPGIRRSGRSNRPFVLHQPRAIASERFREIAGAISERRPVSLDSARTANVLDNPLESLAGGRL